MQTVWINLAQELVSDAEQHLLEQNFDGVGKYLFENQIANVKQASKQAIWYNKHTKQFALTLHYYSPGAYDFVHQVLLLPHPSRIRSWAASVDCEPGFLCEVISFLGNAVQNNAVLSDVVLIVDAMVIQKGTWWDAKQRAYVGRVDYGTGMPEADDDLATEAYYS